MRSLRKKHLITGMAAGITLGILLLSTGRGNEGVSYARHLSEPDFKVQSVAHGTATASGFSFDKGTTSIHVTNNTKSVDIKNPNGTIEFKQGSGSDIEIHTTVDIDQAGEKEAQAVAEKTELRVKEGAALKIETYTERYGVRRHKEASIHLTVTLPKTMTADLQADVSNGSISFSEILSIGAVKLTSANGNLIAEGIGNDISLQSDNGTIEVSDAKRAVQASVMNGNIEANRITGPLDMKTMNGNASAREVGSTVQAVTSTGNIVIQSGKVGGNWKASSNVGNVELAWPDSAGVKVDGKTEFGQPETDFPLTVKNNQVSGTIGKGTYRIEASSMAGLSLMKNR